MRVAFIAFLMLGALAGCRAAPEAESAPLAVRSGLEEATIVAKGME